MSWMLRNAWYGRKEYDGEDNKKRYLGNDQFGEL